MKPLFESWRQYITEGLTKSRQHVFAKLPSSGNWGKVSRSEGKTEEGDLVVEPNTKGFPYDDYKERQEYLNKMAKD
jgi:hypothetical protein